MSPRPSPCDGFTGNLPSYSDHELGPAERSALELHLEACPSCQARLKELETVSNVLKSWDARLPAGETAAVRLQNAVLARIEEDGVRRRREVRWTRVRRLALAAAVLLAVGVPFALGRRAHSGDATVPGGDAPVTYEVVKGPPAAAPRIGGAEPALAAPTLPPDALAHRPFPGVDAAPPDPLPSEHRDALLRMGLAAQREIAQEARFRELTGARGVWVVDPATGARLHVSREAAQVFGPGEPSRGMLHIPSLHRKREEPYTGPLLVEPGELGKTPGDLLRNVLEGDEGTRSWRNRQTNARPPYHFGAPGSAMHRLSAFALSARAKEPGVEVLDPLDAQALGLLTFAPSGSSPATIVAIVEGNELPIFLPPGQILAGGEVDRVTARPIWLPPSPKRAWFQVPVVAVSAGPKRPEDTRIQLTPWIAGPTLRAMLASGAAPQAILEQARSQVALAGSLDWSLLERYGRKDSAALLAHPSIVGFSGHAPYGFLVTDAAGRFLGLEHAAVAGENGVLLMRRLLHGYVLEALRRGPIVQNRSKLNEALDAVVSGETSLRVPAVAAGAEVVGVVRAALADATGAFDTLRVGDRLVWISALPR